ncbi:hypothetical protein LP420_21920 [Massilia sp. B-10]|nr:hypothetical protein LP420_21920 [Massilia sp. B-10]
MPPKLKVRDFTIRDVTAGRNLKVMLKRLDPGRQLGEADTTYYLMRKGAPSATTPRHAKTCASWPKNTDCATSARRWKNRLSLFRVAAKHGFVAGHVYEFENVEEDDDMDEDAAEVSVGARIAIGEGDKFALALQGEATRKLLPVATANSCSARYAAIVQPVQYTV